MAASEKEAHALEEIRREANTRKLLGFAAIVGAVALEATGNANGYTSAVLRDAMLIGGAYAVKSGFDKASETEIHSEAIKELDAKFSEDVLQENIRADKMQDKTKTLLLDDEEIEKIITAHKASLDESAAHPPTEPGLPAQPAAPDAPPAAFAIGASLIEQGQISARIGTYTEADRPSRRMVRISIKASRLTMSRTAHPNANRRP